VGGGGQHVNEEVQQHAEVWRVVWWKEETTEGGGGTTAGSENVMLSVVGGR